MSVDRKSSNGKGTARHETNGSELSTTVQSISGGKAMLSELKGHYSSDVGDQILVGLYGESNRADTQRLAKGRRQYSKSQPPAASPKKGKPAPKVGSRDESPYDEFISEEASRYKKLGGMMDQGHEEQ